MSDIAAIILAAGKGTRMKSDLPKVLHCVAGRPMLSYVLDAADASGCNRKIVVLGFGKDEVAPVVHERAEIAEQTEQLGTGHAVMVTQDLLKDFSGTVIVLSGDTPLLDGRDLRNLYEYHKELGNKATVLTAMMDDATGYGRIVRDEEGQVVKIVEQKDASIQELAIQEINAGIYCFECQELFSNLGQIDSDNAQGEFYLTDVIAQLFEKGEKVGAVLVNEPKTVLGVNSRRQLAEAEEWMQEKINSHFMDEGVTIIDPKNTYIESSVIIGCDTIIYPNTYIEGKTVIGKNCSIGPDVRFTNINTGDHCVVHFTYAHDATFGNGANIGPFVHIRPGTRLADNVKIGNFVEVKNSWVGSGTKFPHLSYIGDSDIGNNVNIGCGTITVNYDGKKKYRTKIEDNSFVGCNSNLIAPVTLGVNSYVAAGSTITVDVPDNALGVGRAKQRNINDWHKDK